MDANYTIAKDILEQGRYLALATADEQGSPWSSPVMYAVTDKLDFIFISSATSHHGANIRGRPKVSWSVYWGEKGPETTDGVTFAGSGKQLDEPSTALAYARILYDQRFPDPTERSEHPPIIEEFEATGRKIYLLVPTAVYKVDRSDPHGVSRQELDLNILRSVGVQHVVRP